MKARYDGMIVFGPDPDRLATFYETALGLTRVHTDDQDISLRIDTAEGNGSFTLLLHHGESKGVDLGTFAVDGLDEAVEQLRRHGAKVLAEPADTPWGTREASVTDPDGNGLTLTEPLGT